MLAAVPIRDHSLSDPSTWNHENYYTVRPGKTASWIQPAHATANDLPNECRTRGESYIWDPLKSLKLPPELFAAAAATAAARAPAPYAPSANPTSGPSSSWGPIPTFPATGYVPPWDPYLGAGFGAGLPPPTGFGFPPPGYYPPSNPYLGADGGAGLGLGSIRYGGPLPSYITQPGPGPGSGRPQPGYMAPPNPYGTYSGNPSTYNPLPRRPPPSFRSQHQSQPPSYDKDQNQDKSQQGAGSAAVQNWSPTQHPNPLNPYDEIDQFHTFDQLDYITLARNLLLYMGQNGKGHLISTPWLREILKVADTLERQRRRIKRDYPYDHKVCWTDDWTFQIPVYETGLSAFVAGDASGGGGGGGGGASGGLVGWWDEVGKVEDHPDWGVDNSATAKLAVKP
jgi:hypothetical protein